MCMRKHCIVFNDNQEIKRRTSGAYRFANLLERRGWRVTVVDWVSSWTEEELTHYLDCIVGEDTQLFGISYTWLTPQWTQEFVRNLRDRYPGRKFILGGQQFVQRDLGVDIALYGYSELAVDDALAWLFDGAALPRGAVRPLELGGSVLVDCNAHYPAMNLGEYAITYREDDFVQPYEQLTVELSRGCKFKCKYCNYAFLGVREDTSTAEELLRKELTENYRRWGTHLYIIADDTLNDRDSKLEMLARVVESLDFEVNFASFIRLDLAVANPHQMELLSRARVWNHFYGIETLHHGAGKAVGKGMHPDRIKQGLLDMREHMMSRLGVYRGTLGMIAGLPGEPPESWHASEQWLRDNWSDNSWEWWPLEISTEHNVATVSDFSRDWQKHGYRELTDPDRIREIEHMYDRRSTGVQHKFDEHSLWWSADWADIGDATEFCYHWHQDPWKIEHKKVANFHLLNYYDDYSKKDLLALTDEWHKYEIVDGHQHRAIIQPYIERKLNSVRVVSRLLSSGSAMFIEGARKSLRDQLDPATA
jgi:hypothetical protein